MTITNDDGKEIALTGEITGVTVYHFTENGVETIPNVPYTLDADGNVILVSFDTKSFSDFGVGYTVDFTYVDEETGDVREISFPGRGTYALTEVLAALGIEGEITNAVLEISEGTADTEALDLIETEDGWALKSEKAFTDTYTLTVTVDGVDHIFTVRDAAGDAYLTITYDIGEDVSLNNVYALVLQNGRYASAMLEGLANSSGNTATIGMFKQPYGGSYPYETGAPVSVYIVGGPLPSDEWKYQSQDSIDGNFTIYYKDGGAHSYNGNNIIVTKDSANNEVKVKI